MHTILIADDNDDLRWIMKNMLKAYNVLLAENGEVAVDIFQKEKPNLTLMDILMPVKDGISATKEILKKNPTALILAITAYSSRAKEMLEVGAREVLIKPVRRDVLIAKIKEYLK